MPRYNPEIHHRRSIRLKDYDYSQAGAYFVTIVVRNRECLLGTIVGTEMTKNSFGQIVSDCWMWLAQQYPYVQLDEWVVMPNHLHGIIVITDEGTGVSRDNHRTANNVHKRKTLGRLIGAFKTTSTKRINQIRSAEGMIFWHRNYYEHIIRNEKALERIRSYIVSNPGRWDEDENHPGRKQPSHRKS